MEEKEEEKEIAKDNLFTCFLTPQVKRVSLVEVGNIL